MTAARHMPFQQVQRIVLHGSVWNVAHHLVLSFPPRSQPLSLLHALKAEGLAPTQACTHKPELQVSLGFSRRGLEHAHVAAQVLTSFASKSPAFTAGAALRASSQLGASGCNVPGAWDAAFNFMTLDAVLSLHADADCALTGALGKVEKMARKFGVQVTPLPVARRLPGPPGPPGPPGVPAAGLQQWTHFGYRDGLSRIGIEGFNEPQNAKDAKSTSTHAAGEFVLGHPQASHANPWIAGPGGRVWPEKLRPFFRDGSFGVLQQVEQDAAAFDRFITDTAKALGNEAQGPQWLKAKLCGRHPDGRPLVNEALSPEADFNYGLDDKGQRCPFGSHIRRMNPRDGALAQTGRKRPLLRRGLPYGPAWNANAADPTPRGLIGHFFCASIEDQYEHLIGEWAERVPLGSPDRGFARDPLFGAHEHGDGAFEIPQPDGQASLLLTGLRAFTRTRGTAYLFYPRLPALHGMAQECLWGAQREDDE